MRTKLTWAVTLEGDTLRLQRDDAQIDVKRVDTMGSKLLDVQHGLKPLLRLKRDKQLLLLQVPWHAAVEVAMWLEVPQVVARRGIYLMVAVGVVWILGSLPMDAMPADGLPAVPFDPLGAMVGALALLVALGRWVRPGAYTVGLGAAWWVLIAFDSVHAVIFESSWWSAIFVALSVYLTYANLRMYQLLREAELGAAEAASRP